MPVDDSDMEGFDSDAEVAEELDKKEKKNKKNDEDKTKNFEEVPKDQEYSDMDSDDIAETRAIAKYMLRKK